jgi:hypothetical protein
VVADERGGILAEVSRAHPAAEASGLYFCGCQVAATGTLRANAIETRQIAA